LAGACSFLPGGRFVGPNVDLGFLIQQAWDLYDYQLIGPAWLHADRFEIQATAADTPASRDELKKMLQNLLAERFRLRVHRETKEFSVYELSVAKSGVKIQPLGAAEIEARAGRTGIGWNRDGLIANNVHLEALARALQRELGRPILDKTGSTDNYDFKVHYDQRLSRPDGGDQSADGSSGASIFTALEEQLGLGLDLKKDPIEVLVIDSADKAPSAN
jgi:uncharacterized protein (TIGR03435 family)